MANAPPCSVVWKLLKARLVSVSGAPSNMSVGQGDVFAMVFTPLDKPIEIPFPAATVSPAPKPLTERAEPI